MNKFSIKIIGCEAISMDKVMANIAEDADLTKVYIFRSQYAILLAEGDIDLFIETYRCAIHGIWMMDYIVRDVLSNAPIAGYLEGIHSTFHKAIDDYTTFSVDSITKLENGVQFQVTDYIDESNPVSWDITVEDMR